jgi:hypothetical protein
MPGLSKSGGSLKKSTPTKSLSKAAGSKLSKSTAVQYASKPKVGANSSGQYGGVPSVPTATAGPIDIEGYLGGDSSYQQQLRQLAKALADFGADATRRQGTLESDYGVSKKALGDQRLLDLDNLEDDYGSRGLLRSGLYGKAVGDYETEYGNRVTDLDRRQQQAMDALNQERSQFGNQNTLQQQAAREAAIRRRAEQYGM